MSSVTKRERKDKENYVGSEASIAASVRARLYSLSKSTPLRPREEHVFCVMCFFPLFFGMSTRHRISRTQALFEGRWLPQE